MKKIKKFIAMLGPGFTTGAADDDPSGIATYSQTGAQFGFNQLWTAPFSLPMMTCIQEMCGRIGIVTGKGLVAIIKHHHSFSLLYTSVALLAIANTFNIGANLGALAAATELILPIPFFIALVIATAVTLFLEIFVPYQTYARYLKYLTLALFSYLATALFVSIPWREALTATILPHVALSRDYFMNLTAIFGTTISPYLFFWQANQEVEELQASDRSLSIPQRLLCMRIDTIFGMFFSNLIMWFIIATTGATLYKAGIHTITSAQEAALALKPFAGEYAFILFAFGIIGTGLLSVPILAGSVAYAVCELRGWKCSLAFTYGDGKYFYHTIGIVMLAGACINLLPVNSIRLLYYSAIINGMISPVLIFIIFSIANNPAIMGNYKNKRYTTIAGLLTGIVMALSGILFIVTTIF
ncbi:divalent metal cation transporter [Candidatus Dependentiae bacterium]|nr:divalent metal cation transporter [Candidatus Dependentiae bacterium]